MFAVIRMRAADEAAKRNERAALRARSETLAPATAHRWCSSADPSPAFMRRT
jgi:hypothetical protein